MPRSISPLVQSGVNYDGYDVQHVALIRDRQEVGDFSTATGWTVLGNDTDNLAVAVGHIIGTKSLEFDKVDGAANQKYAGASATITSVDLSRFTATDHIVSAFYATSVADIEYAFVRLGTSASHYNEWRLADASMANNTWSVLDVALNTCVLSTGNGWDMSAVTYICVGVMLDAQDDTLAGIKVDHVLIRGY